MMKNSVQLEGILMSFRQFSEKVGSIQIKITTHKDGLEFNSSFYLNVFGDVLHNVASVPIGSTISINGRLKNSKFEKDGATTWKLEVIVSSFTFQEAEVGTPTRIAKMSPEDSKYRANSDFGDDPEGVPF